MQALDTRYPRFADGKNNIAYEYATPTVDSNLDEVLSLVYWIIFYFNVPYYDTKIPTITRKWIHETSSRCPPKSPYQISSISDYKNLLSRWFIRII